MQKFMPTYMRSKIMASRRKGLLTAVQNGGAGRPKLGALGC
jgi:hypothetical protein